MLRRLRRSRPHRAGFFRKERQSRAERLWQPRTVWVHTVRDRARAAVVGGGVGGCAIAYWLARLGWDDVVLVERAELTSGSTFHSAGLVGQLRSSLSLTTMMMASVELYRSLEAEVGRG
jgi:NADPH-dependent 2,4-dienoyl-CoA reductase/sulfur reductase-like enzyme